MGLSENGYIPIWIFRKKKKNQRKRWKINAAILRREIGVDLLRKGVWKQDRLGRSDILFMLNILFIFL